MPHISSRRSALLLVTGIAVGLVAANLGWLRATPVLTESSQWLLLPFFALIGFELRAEFAGKGRASLKRLLAPALSALFGAALPVLTLLAIAGPASARAWPVPVATDLTLTLAVFALATGSARNGWRTYLLAFAVFDDILGTLALNASHPSLSPSLIGVLFGLALPPVVAGRLTAVIERPVHYVVVPLFAVAGSMILLSSVSYGPLFLAVLLRPIGKFLGIALGYCLGRSSSGLARTNREWLGISALGALGGVGFTVAFAAADQALVAAPGLAGSAKVATLVAAAVSGLAGFGLLRLAARES